MHIGAYEDDFFKVVHHSHLVTDIHFPLVGHQIIDNQSNMKRDTWTMHVIPLFLRLSISATYQRNKHKDENDSSSTNKPSAEYNGKYIDISL